MDIVFYRFVEMIYEPAVSLRKSNKRLRINTCLSDSRAKIKQSGPRRGLVEFRTIVVATGVIALPDQSFRVKPVSRKPVGKRDLIEIGDLRVGRGHPNWNDEGAFLARISPSNPFVDPLLKLTELSFFFVGRADSCIQTLVPAAFEKQTLFGLTAQVLFLYDQLAFTIAPLDQRHLIKK